MFYKGNHYDQGKWNSYEYYYHFLLAFLFYISNIHAFYLHGTFYTIVNSICEKWDITQSICEKLDIEKGMVYHVSFYNCIHVKGNG
jgi:hypothetical protein